MNKHDEEHPNASERNAPLTQDPEPAGEPDLPTHIILFDRRGNLSKAFDRFKRLFDPRRCWRTNSAGGQWASRKIAEAVQTYAMAHWWAELVVPNLPGSNPFFLFAAREVVYWVTIGLNALHGEGWKLRDFLNAVSSREEILRIAGHSDASTVSIATFFEDDRYSPAILSTILTHIHKFEQIAALESAEPAGNPFSSKEFFTGPGILHIGAAPAFHQGMAPINMLLLEALSDQILRRQENTLGLCLFILDDFPYELRKGSLELLTRLGTLKGADVYVNGACQTFPSGSAKST